MTRPQLDAIITLAALGGLRTTELIPLPLRLRVTTTFDDGTWRIDEIDQDGNTQSIGTWD